MNSLDKITLLDRIKMTGLASLKKYIYMDNIMDGAHYKIPKPPQLKCDENIWRKLRQKSMQIQYDKETIPKIVKILDHYDDVEINKIETEINIQPELSQPKCT